MGSRARGAQLAAELAKVDAMKDLPAAVESKVNDAQEAVADAAKADENVAPAAAENRKEAAEDGWSRLLAWFKEHGVA